MLRHPCSLTLIQCRIIQYNISDVKRKMPKKPVFTRGEGLFGEKF